MIAGSLQASLHAFLLVTAWQCLEDTLFGPLSASAVLSSPCSDPIQQGLPYPHPSLRSPLIPAPSLPFTFPPAFPRPHTLPCLPLCPRYLPPLAPVFLQSSLSVPRAPLKAQSPATCNPIPWHSLLFSNQSQDFIPSHCCAWTNLTPWILGLLPWTRPAVLSRVQFSVTPWTVAFQASLSMGFSRQEYWSGLLCCPPGIFLTQGSNPGLPHCRRILYQLSHQGSPFPHFWVFFPFKSHVLFSLAPAFLCCFAIIPSL